jgi:hypothetical protein
MRIDELTLEATTIADDDILHVNASTIDKKLKYSTLRNLLQNYLVEYRPAVKNISAGNQTTNLSVYEAGGASEKPTGWRIRVSWTGGGVGRTYSHAFTGTGYTIGGSLIATYAGYTYGWLLLELDKTNGDWKIIDSDWIFEQTSSGTLAVNTTYTFAHGLSSTPKQSQFFYVCTSTDLGWAVGDEVECVSAFTKAGVGEYQFAKYSDATNICFIVGNGAGLLSINKSTRAEGLMTLSKWKIRVRYK